MAKLATCPVCNARIEVESDDAGNKVECGHCRSLHRVQEDLSLKTLIESLEFEPAAVEAEETVEVAAGPAPGAPKLVSRREKMREQRAMALASGEGRRRTTTGRSRRR